MKIKHPLLLAQSIAAGLQVLNGGAALDGIVPHRVALLIGLVVGGAQLAVSVYQRGVQGAQQSAQGVDGTGGA